MNECHICWWLSLFNFVVQSEIGAHSFSLPSYLVGLGSVDSLSGLCSNKARIPDILLTYTFLPSCSDSTQQISTLAEFLGVFLLRCWMNICVFFPTREAQSEGFSTLNSLVFKNYWYTLPRLVVGRQHSSSTNEVISRRQSWASLMRWCFSPSNLESQGRCWRKEFLNIYLILGKPPK